VERLDLDRILARRVEDVELGRDRARDRRGQRVRRGDPARVVLAGAGENPIAVGFLAGPDARVNFCGDLARAQATPILWFDLSIDLPKHTHDQGESLPVTVVDLETEGLERTQDRDLSDLTRLIVFDLAERQLYRFRCRRLRERGGLEWQYVATMMHLRVCLSYPEAARSSLQRSRVAPEPVEKSHPQRIAFDRPSGSARG